MNLEIQAEKFHCRVNSLVALLFLLGPVSPLGLIWEISVILLSGLAIVLWVVEQTSGYIWFPGNLWVFFGLFLTDLLLQFFRCTTYRAFGDFLFNITTVAELVNVLALAVGTNINFLRVFRLLTTFDTYNTLVYEKLLRYIPPITLSILHTLYLFFCIWFSCACGYWMVEKSESVVHFADCFYFVTQSISTVGYGDIYPHTTLGKTLVTFFLIIMILGLPYKFGVIIYLLSQRHSSTSTPLSAKSSSRGFSKHAIVIGNLSVENTAAIFRDFFHAHHGVQRSRLVLIPNSPPDPALISMITRSEFYRNHVTYIEGGIFTPQNAFGVLVLPSESNHNLTASKKSSRLASQLATELRIDDQVLRTMYAFKYFQPTSGTYNIFGPLNDHYKADNPLLKNSQSLYFTPSLGVFRAMIIAQSCACPGFSTLLSNLLLSKDQLGSNRCDSTPWSIEYARGASNSIFTAVAPPCLWNKSWKFLVSTIWANFCVICIGVVRKSDERVSVHLNVSKSFQILPKDILLLLGFSLRDRQLIEEMEGICEDTPLTPLDNTKDFGFSASLDLPKFASSFLYTDESSESPPPQLQSLSTIPTAIDILRSHLVIAMTAIDIHLIHRIVDQLTSIYHPPEILPSILIISPTPADPSDLALLEMNSHLNLFFLIGSLRESDTFRRASLEKARTVLLITNWSYSTGSDLPFVVTAVNKYLGEHRSTKVPVITEIRHTHEALFFRPLSSTLSNFTTDDLLSSGAIDSSSDYESMLMFSSGLMLCNYPVHLTMLSLLLHDPNLVHFMNALCLTRRENQGMVVRLIRLPPSLRSHIADGHPLNFSQAFEWLFQEMDVISIGLKRSKRNFSGCPLPYLYTNPCINIDPTSTGIFSLWSRLTLDERTFRSLPRRLAPHTDPILHPSDRIFILPCRNSIAKRIDV